MDNRRVAAAPDLALRFGGAVKHSLQGYRDLIGRLSRWGGGPIGLLKPSKPFIHLVCAPTYFPLCGGALGPSGPSSLNLATPRFRGVVFLYRRCSIRRHPPG
jgi:hypothetical protein